MTLYGMTEVARKFNCTRDQMDCYIRKGGCPDASLKTGRRRSFTEDDVAAIRRWFMHRGKRVPATARSGK